MSESKANDAGQAKNLASADPAEVVAALVVFPMAISALIVP